MRMYRTDAAQVFKVLASRSQETNTKIWYLATRLVTELPTLPETQTQTFTQFDHLLLTAHTRVRCDPH
ncbi:hypothetical protein [Nocardia kruczakiae]|uniref:hypothetical protein n=1 Tax=Nocardia kruczakiae TaxID=261477 RepID=UPI001FE0F20D|nr:hypothetical protein [Nocardia kruczakiae]